MNKFLFLDFDGVLNSTQECEFKFNRRKTSIYWNWRDKFSNFLYRFKYKKVKYDSGFTLSARKDPFGIGEFLVNLSRNHISDYCEFCPIACSNIQVLLDKYPDLRIVVSSVWRHDGLKRLKKILKRNRIDSDRVIGITGHKGPGGSEARGRGDQIQAWLNDNGYDYKSDSFVIVDDDSDMCDLMDHLVKTNGNEGFMWHHIDECRKILERK